MSRVAFVLLDGLNLRAGLEKAPNLAALAAARGVLRAPWPPLSRPVYATLLTGLDPGEHGVVVNERGDVKLNRHLFGEIKKAGLSSAVACYHWFYELCAGKAAPGAVVRGDPDFPADAFFYSRDDFPDKALFATAESSRQRLNPDFLFAHSMGVDFAGHAFGGQSREYDAAVANVDKILATLLPVWRDAGYEIIVAGDHGMDAAGLHSDAADAAVLTPVWTVGARRPPTAHAEFYRFILHALLNSL